MTDSNKQNGETNANKKFKKLLVPIVGLVALIVIGVIIILLNPGLVNNISQKTNMTPSSSSSKAEVKKTTYSYGDFPDFRMIYPVDWQVGSISTKQFSLSKGDVKAIITLEAPSVSGLTSITCNMHTNKVNDKITRVHPIGRTESIYLPSSSIFLKGSEKYSDVIKSTDLTKASESEKEAYAMADSCGSELYTALTKTKLPANSGINSPAGQGWFRIVASGDNKELLKELDEIVSQISGLYWE
jgi:hypothetical protein